MWPGLVGVHAYACDHANQVLPKPWSMHDCTTRSCSPPTLPSLPHVPSPQPRAHPSLPLLEKQHGDNPSSFFRAAPAREASELSTLAAPLYLS
jgi:hypothetical protein